jgi:hypothetical protein
MHISAGGTEPASRKVRLERLLDARLPPGVRTAVGDLQKRGDRSDDAFRLLRLDFDVHRSRILAI